MTNNDLAGLLSTCRPWLRGRIVRFASGNFSADLDASDFASIAIMLAWKNQNDLLTLESPQVLKWLWVTARRLAIDSWRKQQSVQIGRLTGVECDEASASACSQLDKAEEVEQVSRCLNELSALQQSVLQLRREGRSHKMIGEKLCITPEYSAQLFRRALNSLRTRLRNEL